MIEVSDTDLRRAAAEGMDAFLAVFTDAYRRATDDHLTAENMACLTAPQHTLLAYTVLRDELMEGGFCQLVQNGYGAYIFHNPVARALKGWGLDDARRIYDAHREDLERERTDDEFMAMYEQYEAFDPLEEEFIEHEEEWTARVAAYVDGHLEEFAHVTGWEE